MSPNTVKYELELDPFSHHAIDIYWRLLELLLEYYQVVKRCITRPTKRADPIERKLLPFLYARGYGLLCGSRMACTTGKANMLQALQRDGLFLSNDGLDACVKAVGSV